jgi:hypothetical protein
MEGAAYLPKWSKGRKPAGQDFATAYGTKYPKATAKITDDAEQLLAFFDLPAER